MDLLDLTGRAEATHFWFRGFRRIVGPVVARAAGGRPGLRLIDCGCGTGANLALLSPHGRTYGFELTAWGSEHAKATQHLPIVRADITRVPLEGDTFDIVTAFDVLQIVPDDRAAAAELARVLKPGGTLILTVAAFAFLRADHGEVWKEARRYTPSTVRALVESAGLRVERVSFMFAFVFPLLLAARLSQRLLRPLREAKADRDIAVPSAPVNGVLTWLMHREAEVARHVPMPIGSSLLVIARKV